MSQPVILERIALKNDGLLDERLPRASHHEKSEPKNEANQERESEVPRKKRRRGLGMDLGSRVEGRCGGDRRHELNPSKPHARRRSGASPPSFVRCCGSASQGVMGTRGGG
jgi:hypothetical protein